MAGLSAAVKTQMERLGAERLDGTRPAGMVALPWDQLPEAYREWVLAWDWPAGMSYVSPGEEDEDIDELREKTPGLEAFMDTVYGGVWDVDFSEAPQFLEFAEYAEVVEKHAKHFAGKIPEAARTRRYLTLAMTDGGNYFLVADLTDPDPSDPQVRLIDHETLIEDLWGEVEMPAQPLSHFLKYLVPAEFDDEFDDFEDEDDEE